MADVIASFHKFDVHLTQAVFDGPLMFPAGSHMVSQQTKDCHAEDEHHEKIAGIRSTLGQK